MSSINAATIGTLVNAITGGLSSGQTYDLVRKISEDLDAVYSTVYSGPLQAVDASALLHINPVNIDSPGDNPIRVTSPGKVAFINWANVFTPVQSFVDNIIGGNGKAIYVGSVVAANLRFYWDNLNAAIRFGVGAATFVVQDGAATGLFQVYPSGAAMCGVGAVGGAVLGPDPALAGFALFNGNSLYSRNAANNANLKMVLLDANDVIRLGSDAANTGKGHIAIPKKTTANLPAAGANQDGTIALDTTTGQLCYWVNGGRFAIAVGAAF